MDDKYAQMRMDLTNLTMKQLREIARAEGITLGYDGATKRGTVDAIVSNTRWHKLFGTPEKVADYFATQCMGGDAYTCEICPFADCNGGLHVATHPTIRNELLEWLRGDAE